MPCDWKGNRGSGLDARARSLYVRGIKTPLLLLSKALYRYGEDEFIMIGPIPWGHSGPLCHALSLSSLYILHLALKTAEYHTPMRSVGWVLSFPI